MNIAPCTSQGILARMNSEYFFDTLSVIAFVTSLCPFLPRYSVFGLPPCTIWRNISTAIPFIMLLLFHPNPKEFGPAGPELYAQFLSLLWRYTVKGSGSIPHGQNLCSINGTNHSVIDNYAFASSGSATVSINSPLIPSSSHPTLGNFALFT